MTKNSISLIDNSCNIGGDFFSSGTVDVSGKIVGNIVIDILNIKDGGVIVGKIYAKELNITGGSSVDGDIYAGKIKVCDKSQISGNVFYHTLSIEDGGVLKGVFANKTKEQIDEIFNNEMKKLPQKSETAEKKKNEKNNEKK